MQHMKEIILTSRGLLRTCLSECYNLIGSEMSHDRRDMYDSNVTKFHQILFSQNLLTWM